MPRLNSLKQKIGEEKWYSEPFAENAGLARAKMRLAGKAYDEFVSMFGDGDRDVQVHHVPGRVEVLGNHSDYAGGMVLNFASDRGMIVVSAPSPSPHLRIADAGGGAAALEIDLDTLRARAISPGEEHWFIYPRSIAARLISDFGRGAVGGLEAAFASDLPQASGMSSSSTLSVAVYLILAAHGELQGNPLHDGIAADTGELATYLGCCENGFDYTFKGRTLKGVSGVGLSGGSQDHTAILAAKKMTLSLNRYRPVRHIEDLSLPPQIAFVVAFSGFPSSKARQTQAAFNLIAARIAAVPQIYNNATGTQYRYAGQMLGLDVAEVRGAIEKGEREEAPALLERYAHFYEQNDVLIPRAVEALRSGDERSLGEAIDASHESCRRYLRNISPRIDTLVRCGRAIGAVGASGFGAGFGGSAYAVVMREKAEDFLKKWRESYLRECRPPTEPRFFICEPASGACRMFDPALGSR